MQNGLKALTLTVLAALIAAPASAAQPISYRTYHYTCDGGKKISVSYFNFGETIFAVLNYAGRQYGLAQAVSASGSRYASLFGPVTKSSLGSGLEWWEWHGKATLSTFKGSDTANTTELLTNCKTR